MVFDGLAGEPINIRFDGFDADQHEIELGALGKSLIGISRILAVTGTLVLTEEIRRQSRSLEVRVVAQSSQEQCFTIHAIQQYSHHHPFVSNLASATVSGLTVLLVQGIVSRINGPHAELKHLRAMAELMVRQGAEREVVQAQQQVAMIEQQTALTDRLFGMVDKLTEAIRPALRQAVEPIGSTARTLTIKTVAVPESVVIDEATKDAILSPAGLTVDEERPYEVLISELDMQTGVCHVALNPDTPNDRLPAKITDPEVHLPNNVYVMSMASLVPLSVKAKATMHDGNIQRLYISNHAGRVRGDPNFSLS